MFKFKDIAKAVLQGELTANECRRMKDVLDLHIKLSEIRHFTTSDGKIIDLAELKIGFVKETSQKPDVSDLCTS